ncbi:phosphohistidine phosphatase SixA [Ramlibacter solisilvae]|uniref:Phosphohistidine phosphatase n=1 Tax=Ramlibacter tataouinensis TaxID=94132 RepID=A0A127JNS5_9BURK|nr:phosphohistidine phosphatase SixA [Ramlibacter tataouinensis]AMO21646.1 phosphohistidine phosphatase [Ramlibacter tataouinensis]
MELILWRHAEAEEVAPGADDLRRALTTHGEKQAARVALWLDRQLVDSARILCSPALRCEQTVMALGRKYKVREELAPGGSPDALLAAARWPDSRQPVLIVGHQPLLGETAAHLLGVDGRGLTIRKGGVWWFRSREREGGQEAVLMAALSPGQA